MRPDRSGSDGPAARRRRAPGAIVAAAAIALIVLLLPSLAVATAWADPPSWGNGVVFCAFESELPGLTASPASAVGTGLFAQGSFLEERDDTGAVVGSANLATALWTVTNGSDEDTFELEYNASVPVTNGTTRVGAVSVAIDFVLPAYAGSDPLPANVVAMDLAVLGWPWHSSGDSLIFSVTLAPGTSDEHLVLPNANVSSVNNATGSPVGTFVPGTHATALSPGVGTETISAVPLASTQGTGAVVTTVFQSGEEYPSLNYTSHIEVTVPSTVAGLPLTDYVLVGGAAAVIVAVVGLAGRRIRRRPSDLVFAE